MENVRTMTFMACQSGLAEDLYRCKETGRVYIRQTCNDEYVRWLTSSKLSGGYEAECSLREGLVLHIVDRNGAFLIRESIIKVKGYMYTVAEKIAPFSWEAIKAFADEQAEKHSLRDYEEWKAWLMADAEAARFVGDKDTWMYYHVEYGTTEKVARLDYLGKTAYATVTEATHTICGKKWKCYEIMSADMMDVEALCGYAF